MPHGEPYGMLILIGLLFIVPMLGAQWALISASYHTWLVL
jgi:hypothetical protein